MSIGSFKYASLKSYGTKIRSHTLPSAHSSLQKAIIGAMNIRTVAGITYLSIIHLLLAVVLWKSDFIDKVQIKLGMSSLDTLSFYEQTTLYHQRMDSSIADSAVIFIGDSITQALATSAVTTTSVNFGIGTDTTRGVVERLPLYQSIKRSTAVVLAIGVNDIYQQVDPLETRANYKNILDSMPTDISVIAASVLPVGSVAENKHFTNADITSLNSDIKALANEYSNVIYLDVNEKLKDETGFLPPEFHIGDGVHLSHAGYRILINSLSESLAATALKSY